MRDEIAAFSMGLAKLGLVRGDKVAIVGGVLLAVSRAIGETMIVVMAAGLSANLTANPLEAVTTVTVQIVTLLVGDQEFDSPKTLAAFALGLVLFIVTLTLNEIALHVVRRYREQYEKAAGHRDAAVAAADSRMRRARARAALSRGTAVPCLWPHRRDLRLAVRGLPVPVDHQHGLHRLCADLYQDRRQV
jgi:hypothetical protein